MRSRSSWVFGLVAALGFGMPAGTPAWGLDPGRAITQFIQTTWTSESGLPQNSVHAITQTRDGFLWLGTEEGFARFDGVQFKVYNTRNARGLPSDYIQSLAASRDGSLWVGTDSGLSHFVPASPAGHAGTTLAQSTLAGSFTKQEGLAGDRITALHEDPDGTLWVGTAAGLSRIRQGRVEAGATELKGTAVDAIIGDRSGHVWIATEAGLFESDHGRLVDWSRKAQLPSRIVALAPDPDGSLWIGTLDHGLIRFRDGRVLESSSTRWNEITGLLIDRDGALWISYARHGIGRLFHGRLSNYRNEDGLPSNRVTRALFEDSEGSLWVGMLDAGTVQFREGTFAVFGTREGLAGDYAGNILQSRDGTMWIGTDSNGLNHLFAGGRVEVWNQARGLPNQAVYSMLEDRNGDLWVGFRAGALAEIHEGRVRVYQDPQAAHVSLNAIFEDREGNLWIGFFGKGVARFKNGIFEHLTSTGRVPSIAQTADGALWVASDGDGIERFINGTRRRFTTADGLPSNHVMGLYADAGGDLWVGTASGGLSRIRDSKVASWTVDQGLPEPTVGSIIEDNRGMLWIGGDNGIYSFSKQALNQSSHVRIAAYQAYGSSDGLRSRETLYGSMPSTWKDRSGRLWFATPAGAAVVDPEHMKVDTVAPPLWIESVTFDGRSMPLQQGLKLGPGMNNLDIGFTSPTFSTPQHERFRYKLLGFDHDWIDAGARRDARYTNLAPGEYTFTVQAENSDGVWNTVGDPFRFVLRPPLTRTPVAYGVYIIGIVLVCWGALALRTRALVRRQQELTRIVAERTEQLEQEKLALEAAREELHTRATYDSLTRLFNRAAIIEHLQREIHRANRNQAPLGVMIVDLDHFKQVNDRYGHLCGDDVLREAAERLRDAMRNYDFIGRYGGEEFLVLFPGWSPDLAPGRIDDLLDAIRGLPFTVKEYEIRMTCSIGVCVYSPEAGSTELRDILSRADAALYAAKNQGRNRACVDRSAVGSCHSTEA